jgi:polyhydroxyalkanoate synthesis repressor PhaR
MAPTVACVVDIFSPVFSLVDLFMEPVMPRIIKKYPNRRLYDTETSAYITLAEIKQFVLEYQVFAVHDARTNEDLTRSILLQIILEEESGGVPMFSADMLGNIIRYYGHSMQGLMGSYLERSIGAFHEAQRKFQAQSQTIYGAVPAFKPDAWTKIMQPPPSAAGGATGMGGIDGTGVLPNVMGDYLEKSATSVIGMQEELRKQAMQMFSTFPFVSPVGSKADEADSAMPPKTSPAAEPVKTAKAAAAKSNAKTSPKPRAKKASGK